MTVRILSEQYFPEMNRHRKEPSASSSTIDEVEAFAKAKGIINLDNPEVKKKTVIADLSNFELARYEAQKERERLEAEAQENYKKALANIEDGTAVHRVKHERIKPAKPARSSSSKSTTNKQTEPLASTKSRKSDSKKRNAKAQKIVRDKPTRNEITQARRQAIIDQLKTGGRILLLKQEGVGNAKAYQQQRSDIKTISKDTDLNIVRIASIKTGLSYFVVDDFKRYQTDKKISSRLVKSNNHDLLKAICSLQLVQASDIAELNKDGSRAMAILARNYGFDIYTVLASNALVGWVLIENKDETFNEVKERQGLKLILAYERFKSVAQDSKTTIAEILAIKDGQ